MRDLLLHPSHTGRASMRPRFSLRTLLIAITITGAVLGVALAWRQSIIHRTERHLRAVEVLYLKSHATKEQTKDFSPAYVNFVRKHVHPQAFEVSVIVDLRRPSATPQHMAPATPEHMALLKDVNGLKTVFCSFDRFTMQDAKALTAVRELRGLHVTFTTAQDGALSTIAKIQTLDTLTVHGAVDDAFFDALSGHPHLSVFSIVGDRLTPHWAKAIATIPNLTTILAQHDEHDPAIVPIFTKLSLDVLGLKLKQCDLNALQSLEQSRVKNLVLDAPQFEKGTIRAISKSPQLESLTLIGPIEIAPKEMESLKSCTKLKQIDMRSASLAAEDWDSLISHPSLMTVQANGAKSASEAIQRFRDSKPNRQALTQ
jgi:hypothetical protein